MAFLILIIVLCLTIPFIKIKNAKPMDKKEETMFSYVFCSALFLIFLIFKLANIGIIAEWSWWWVISPLWGLLFQTIWPFIIIIILFKLFG
jgi:hypothetical protein